MSFKVIKCEYLADALLYDLLRTAVGKMFIPCASMLVAIHGEGSGRMVSWEESDGTDTVLKVIPYGENQWTHAALPDPKCLISEFWHDDESFRAMEMLIIRVDVYKGIEHSPYPLVYVCGNAAHVLAAAMVIRGDDRLGGIECEQFMQMLRAEWNKIVPDACKVSVAGAGSRAAAASDLVSQLGGGGSGDGGGDGSLHSEAKDGSQVDHHATLDI